MHETRCAPDKSGRDTGKEIWNRLLILQEGGSKKVKGKKLVSLISTEGKTPEQISKEAKEAFEKFSKTLEKSKKQKGEKKDEK